MRAVRGSHVVERAMSMGGRDCSLQMHEQKLLEVSVTVESLQRALTQAKASGHAEEARVLTQDIATLTAMEQQAENFLIMQDLATTPIVMALS